MLTEGKFKGGWRGKSMSRRCRIWVKTRHHALESPCPLYPQKRTLADDSWMSALGHKRTQPARAVLSSIARLLLPQLPSATFGAAGSGVAASCSVVCSSVALATGLIITMGIATYTFRLAARNTPSGSPRFLALPVLNPFPVIVPNRAYCHGVRRYSMKLAPSALSLR
jgi:hypothetical protein